MSVWRFRPPQQKRKIYGDAGNGGVRRGDIVIDAGAHVGTYVRTALDAGAAKVIAVEPSSEALECLRRNFAAEVATGRVVIYPKGIWDEEKRLVFYANGNGSRIHKSRCPADRFGLSLSLRTVPVYR